jgi:hypothetical protein
MKTFLLAAALTVHVGATPLAAQTQRNRDQEAAAEARRAGQIRPLREIEGRVVPRMVGTRYLGPEFDPATSVYRLKFMRGGTVIWVDVDGRTGAVIGRSGE